MKRILRVLILLYLIIATPKMASATLSVTFSGVGPTLSGCDSVYGTFSATATGCATGAVPNYTWIYVHAPGGSAADTVYSATTSSTFATYTFLQLGYYHVGLKVVCGTDSATSWQMNMVHVNAPPAVNFTTAGADSGLVCGPRIVSFINTSIVDTSCPGFTWNWIVVSSTWTHSYSTRDIVDTFTTPGRYSVILIFNSPLCGCFGSIVKTDYITIDSPAHACFTPTSSVICAAPDNVTFNAGCSSGAYTYRWEFGDASSPVTTGSPSVTHMYYDVGFHDVKLTAYSAAGCPDTVRHNAAVFVGDFSAMLGYAPDTICFGTPTAFTDSSSIYGYTVSTSTFTLTHVASGDVVDGGSGPTATFPFNYTTHPSGLFRIADSAVESHGCSAIAYKFIYVRPAPVVDSLSADTLYQCSAPVTEHFIAYPSTSSLTYTWAFSSVAAATTSGMGLHHVTYTYTSSGTFSPTVTVTDRYGCSSSVSRSSYISISRPNIRLNKSVDSGCATPGLVVRFTVDATPSSLPFSIDSVTFGDSSVPCYGDGCVDSAHTYTDSGTHPMMVYYHLPDYLGGCSGFDSTSVKVGASHPNYTFDIFPSANICPHTVDTFLINCTNCTGYTWHFLTDVGLGFDTVGVNRTTILYDAPSPPPVFADSQWKFHVIMSFNGCTDTVDSFVYVYGPKAGTISGVSPVCTRRDSFRFTLSGATGANKYFWTFTRLSTGVMTVDSTLTPYIDKILAGAPAARYKVMVMAKDTIHGCTNWALDSVIVQKDTAYIHADHDTVCVGQSVTFTGPVDPVTGSAFSAYSWRYGDGSFPSSGGYSMSHTFTTTGTFYDTLVYLNSTGCQDTTWLKSATVRARIRVDGITGGFTALPSLICAGDSIRFRDNNTSTSVLNNRHWYNFNSTGVPGSPLPNGEINVWGRTTSGRGDTAIFYSVPGTYVITLSDTDRAGCTSLTSRTVSVVKPSAYFTSPDGGATVCTTVPVYFHDTNTHCTYSWWIGIGSTGTWTTPSATAQDTFFYFPTNGLYTVKCAISSDGTYYPAGCSDTFVRTNYINVSGFTVASNNYGSDSLIACPPLRVIRYATNPFLTYTWFIESASGRTGPYTGAFINRSLFTSGPVRVILYATNTRGCVDSTVYRYFIGGPAGYLTLSSDSGCAPHDVTVHFIDTGTVTASSSYIWNSCVFGSTSTTADSFVMHFPTAGVYCVPTVTIQNGSCIVNIENLRDSIRIYPVPVLTITHPAILCYGDATTLVVSGADNYVWTPGTGLSATTGNVVGAFPLTTQTYFVTGTTIHGCFDTISTTVRVNPPINIYITGKDSVCLGTCDTLVAHGLPGAAYVWNGIGVSCAVCDTNVICITSTHTYTVHATDGAGCSDSAFFTVTVHNPPKLHVTPDPAHVCRGIDTTHLYASGAASYIWEPRIGLSCDSCSSPLCTIQSNIIYSLTGTSIYGCRDSIIVPVVFYDTTQTGISDDTSICRGDRAELIAYGGQSYIWKPNTYLNEDRKFKVYASPIANTTYTVYITENVCFKDTLTVNVRVVQMPVLVLPPNQTIIAGNSVQLYASYGDSANHSFLTQFTWTPADSTLTCFDCPRPIASPVVTTTYSVVASTIEGCTGTGSVTINVICEGKQIFIPNTFTPNGDGVNDRFYVSGRGLALTKRMTIFNRWGEIVYDVNDIKSNDPGSGWDGTYKGEVLSPDVYMYLIEVQCSTGEPFTFKGDISLVR